MGNEHSGGGPFVGGGGGSSSRGAGTGGSSPTTVSLGGMPSSFSFLAKKRNSTPKNAMANSIVVVNEGAASTTALGDPSKDADLKRIKEIPHFLPLLRGVLPGYRDPPEVHQKIDPKYIARFLHRLQHHFRQCAQMVATEQGRMFAHIVEIDQLISSLFKKMATNSKRLEALNAELKRFETVEEQLESTQMMLLELTRAAESLNLLLAPDERLPPLQIAFTPILTRKKWDKSVTDGKLQSATTTLGSSRATEIDPRKVSETRVVDRK